MKRERAAEITELDSTMGAAVVGIEECKHGIKKCPACAAKHGRGARSGKGSRLRLWMCACGIKVRVASDDFRATCLWCAEPFGLLMKPASSVTKVAMIDSLTESKPTKAVSKPAEKPAESDDESFEIPVKG